MFYLLKLFAKYTEESIDLYSSSNIVLVIKSRRMRWVGHVERMGARRGVYRILVEKPEEKKTTWIIIKIIWIIIIYINCSWVVTRWQWLFYMYTKYEIGY